MLSLKASGKNPLTAFFHFPLTPQAPCKNHSTLCFYEFGSFFFFFFFFFCFFFLGLHLWHMEVPKLGGESELQLPADITATATPDPLTHRGRPGIEPTSS